MKKCTFLILIAFAIALSSFRGSVDGGVTVEKDRIEVSFNRHMSFNDVVKVKLDLSQRGITINYNKLEFDPEGGLKAIDFSVDCNDGFKGSASSENIINQGHFGFYRDYKDGAPAAFATGDLKD